MIFTYWTGEERISDKFLEFWNGNINDFKVFSSTDVDLIVKKRYPELFVPYSNIRIPSCKSDISRLILLEEFGGLYIDAHTGCQNFASLANWLSNSVNYDFGILDRISLRTSPNGIHLVNGALYAKKNTLPINLLIKKIETNIINQYEIEKSKLSYEKYNIAALTGAWNLVMLFFERKINGDLFFLKDDFKESVSVTPLGHDENAFLTFYRYYDYRSQGQHWSERQQHERLFNI